MNQQEALAYLGERTGKLEYRFLRYGAVADELYAMGLTDQHLIVDIGAGMCDFDYYLRTIRGFKGRYLPVDASIDGRDLNDGIEHVPKADFTTCIEVLEHLGKPESMIRQMIGGTRLGVVVTTPNTDMLGPQAVFDMDRTHVRPLYQKELRDWGFNIRKESFFGSYHDSLLGVWKR